MLKGGEYEPKIGVYFILSDIPDIKYQIEQINDDQ